MYNLRPHQKEAVSRMHNGCVLIGGVGTGKSITALAYYYERVCGGETSNIGPMANPRNLVIITTAKKRDSRDWEKEALPFGMITKLANPFSGVTLRIDSWNNIGKYTEEKDAFFIFDESKIVGSGAWVKAFLKIAKSNQWVLLSATPGDTWLDYIPLFLAHGFYKNRTEFKREHVVYSAYSKFPKVERYLGTGKLVRLRNLILVDMPYERHTKRHMIDVSVDYDKTLYDKVVKERWHVYEERPIRDVAEMFSTMRRCVNSDVSRITALKEVMEKHPRVIVFYNFNYELEMLRSLASSATPSSTKSALTESLTPGESLSPSPQASPRTTTTESSVESSSSTTLPMLSGSDTMSGGCGSRTRQHSSEKELGRPSQSTTSESSTSTCGRWTEDTGNGEMWIPSHVGISSLSSSMPKQSKILSTASSPDLSRETSLSETRQDTGTSFELAEDNHPQECEVWGGHFVGEGEDMRLEPCDGVVARSFEIAEWNGHKHEAVPKTSSWVYLVQYMAGAEGWNCIETDAVVFFSQTYSYKQYEQAQGRIDRMNTPFTDLYYYNFLSNSSIDLAIRKSLKMKKSFNEKDFR